MSMASNKTRQNRARTIEAMAGPLCIILLCLLPFGLLAGQTRVDSFTEGLSKAKSLEAPLAVLIHGSSWSGASKRLHEEIWQNLRFANLLASPSVITSIHVRQNQGGETAERDKARQKGWKDEPVKTHPAVQVYGHDGQLLKTLQGRALIQAGSKAKLAAVLNSTLKAARQRTVLLRDYKSAIAAGNNAKALDALEALIRLPLNREPGILKKLKQVDPQDRSGWQARLNFSGWEHMRETTRRLGKGEAAQVLSDSNKRIALNVHPPKQLTFILAAKGRALAKLGRHDEAWRCFYQGAAQVPGSPDSIAIFNYGLRVAGAATRDILDPRSPLARARAGENLTKDRASFTLSSQAHDNGSQHATLFSGPYSPRGSAFHTNNEAGAHIIIDLDGPCELRALNIVNHNNNRQRASGLTIWISSNQRNWKKIWQAEKVQAKWEIILDSPVRASFLKVGLPEDSRNFLHLQAVDAYGKRL